MIFTETKIPDVKILTPRKFEDDRGFFSETHNTAALAELGIDLKFVQDNDSLSVHRGTVHGLHFQISPFAQDKLVRVVHGAIFDCERKVR